MATTPSIALELLESGEGDPRVVVNRNATKLDGLVPTAAQKAAYDVAATHAQITSGNPHGITLATIGAAPAAHNHDDRYYTQAQIDAAIGTLACRVYSNATQSVPHNVLTGLNFNSERFDIGGLHESVTNPSRITCTIGGIYQITGQIAWPQLADNTRRQIQIRLNGGAAIGATETFASSATGLFLTQIVTTLWQLNVGDYIELAAFQNSGAALTLPAAAGSQEFMMARV